MMGFIFIFIYIYYSTVSTRLLQFEMMFNFWPKKKIICMHRDLKGSKTSFESDLKKKIKYPPVDVNREFDFTKVYNATFKWKL